MSYKFPVPDTSNIPTRPAFLIFSDRIPRMCHKCQDFIFGVSEEDSEEICMITFG
jgi:hypothetical protein